ncbi:hypothetical protein C5167_004678 [Papaver somniferum]|uniref:Integrator complex subunit 3 N-terminal domain-containing protein n=1 Tax=Papaver somniferum TaxID=3469 RepID=A0A4Y7JBC8_PAPSO|nr:hypothetical protein C5167_004678 [Papaver somniferum]
MASKLFHISPHQAESQIEISLREAFQLLETQLRVPFSLKIPSPSEYLELNRAIVYGILSEPHFANIHFTHLNAIVTDGYTYVFYLILKLVYESYSKLLEPVKVNLIWVTSKLVEVSAIGTDNLLAGLLRQIVGGDISDGNLWLCMELLKLCLDKDGNPVEVLTDPCEMASSETLPGMRKNLTVRGLSTAFRVLLKKGVVQSATSDIKLLAELAKSGDENVTV